MRIADAPLWIAGATSEHSKSLAALADRLGVKVWWMGHLSRERVRDAMRKASIFCLPSIPKAGADPHATWMEQFGQVLIEAMACGTPVVATRTGAIPEVVSDGGHLVEPMSPYALALALRSLLTKPDRWKGISETARSRAESVFDDSIVGKEIVEWYELNER